MKRLARLLVITTLGLALVGCATATGAVIGAGIGSLSGDMGKGAAIGGAIGAVVDIVD